MDADFLQARIDATKLLIVAYEDALLALSARDGIKTYKIDTGQSVQTVTAEDIGPMNKIVDSLYNRCATLEARLNGSGVVTVRPCF